MIYALDFDGVICDSAVETAITGWKAAGQIWSDMQGSVPETLITQFRQVRPIIETGYEAILAMRLLFLGESCAAIYSDYEAKTKQLLEQAQVTTDELKKLFGETRDHWIADDLSDWIRMNPLFAGVAEKLRAMGHTQDWYVVTTKQERFVKHILSANAIELDEARIFGLDRQMSKPQVLRHLLSLHPDQAVRFVEDRLPTLLNVQSQPDLTEVELLFALWGYNTDEDKLMAEKSGFTTQKLSDFLL
jgi:phosphoglycolate phosphatase-like HAD superfamily hydrolase